MWRIYMLERVNNEYEYNYSLLNEENEEYNDQWISYILNSNNITPKVTFSLKNFFNPFNWIF